MPRCEACPLHGLGGDALKCEGEQTPVFCERVRGGRPGFAELAVRLAKGEPPTVFEQVRSFGESAVRHVTADLGRDVTPGQKEARLGVCRACEHFDAGRTRCGVCGCFLEVKTAWPSESCPVGRWGPVTEPTGGPGCPDA